MKQRLKLFGFILGCVFWISCGGPHPSPDPSLHTGDHGEEEESGSPKDLIPTAEAADKKAKAKEKCAGNPDCEEICDDIFDHPPDKRFCEGELSVAQAEDLKEVYNTLESPGLTGFDDLNIKRLRVLISISAQPFKKLIHLLHPLEAKQALIRLAEDMRAVKLFKIADNDFKVLDALLEKLNSNKTLALNTPIALGDSFVELALAEKNREAVTYVNEWFKYQCDDSPQKEKCVFKGHYCKLELDEGAELDYLKYNFFKKLVEDILDNFHTPPAGWSEDTGVEDLEGWLSLCDQVNFS